MMTFNIFDLMCKTALTITALYMGHLYHANGFGKDAMNIFAQAAQILTIMAILPTVLKARRGLEDAVKTPALYKQISHMAVLWSGYGILIGNVYIWLPLLAIIAPMCLYLEKKQKTANMKKFFLFSGLYLMVSTTFFVVDPASIQTVAMIIAIASFVYLAFSLFNYVKDNFNKKTLNTLSFNFYSGAFFAMILWASWSYLAITHMGISGAAYVFISSVSLCLLTVCAVFCIFKKKAKIQNTPYESIEAS